ncbi:heme-binding protein [Rariglobus hedericola]
MNAAQLSSADVERIYVQAADRAAESSMNSYVIALVDRDGRVLLVRRANGAGAVTATERAIAISKAGTAVFLSSNRHAFTTRTAGSIIQQNFPAGVLNRPPGPLVGVGFSNLALSDINFFRENDGVPNGTATPAGVLTPGSRILGTRLYASPGGVPLYVGGQLVAGIGVTGDGTETENASITGADGDEAVALAGQIGYGTGPELWGSNVFIDGIRVDYVASIARLASSSTSTLPPQPAPPAPVVWPVDVLGGVRGEVRALIKADPVPGLISGQPRLTAAEVRQVLALGAERTRLTRAGIRLPAGQGMQAFITVVNNPNQAGVPATVLGTFRTPDATIFSWDVSVQKARTAVFFSNATRAFSSRTVGFLAQTMYPPGINGTSAGPFNGLQERYSGPLLTGVGTPNANLPNGITIFPGGIPLYRNGVLIGAIGVSGDGIDQDDLVAASGTFGLQPAQAIRADETLYLGVRLPYAKFPRDSALETPVPAIAPGFPTFTALNFTEAELASGLITAPGVDTDGDGLSNLFEYAFGLDPRVADAAGAGPMISVNGSSRLEIVFRRVSAAIDLVYSVEVSTNLTTWTPIARSTGGGAVQNLGGAQSIVETGVGTLTVTVEDAVAVTGPGSRFLRLTVTRP